VIVQSGDENAPTVVVPNSSGNPLTTVVQFTSVSAHKLLTKVVFSQNSSLK
jgi:hypothetical protein